MTTKVKAFYGFSPELPPFTGKSPAEQVGLLRAWGANAVFGGYQDPGFVEAIHQAGMKIYAEFSCFVGADWWEKVPASRPVTDAGQLLENEGWYYGVNPAHPEVRRAKLEALEKLLSSYAIDGVWLDFIRWPCRWEGQQPRLPQTSFDAETLIRFSQDTGIQLPQNDPATTAHLILSRHEAAWTAWRCEQITNWTAQAHAILERMRPQAVLGLFGIPWRLTDFDGAILKIMGQDYQALAQYVDVFSPMVYHFMCGRSPDWIGAVTEEIRALTGKPVWPIIQAVDKPGPLPADEYGQALDIALNHPASNGVLTFTLKDVLDEAKLAITKAAFAEG